MSPFLSAAELHELTKLKRYGAQCRELDRLKVRYRIARNGAPIVLRTDLDAKPKAAQRSEPRWDRIASVRNL